MFDQGGSEKLTDAVNVLALFVTRTTVLVINVGGVLLANEPRSL